MVEPDRFAQVQNAKHVLGSLFVQLSAEEAPGDGVVEARRRFLAALAAMP